MRQLPTLLRAALLSLAGVSLASAQGSFHTDIYSDSALPGSGTLAVFVEYPDKYDSRHRAGAPVVLYSPGGVTNTGSFGPDQILEGLVELGFVSVRFLLPGGSFATYSSGGIYDNRSTACTSAMRDALLYAAGRATDTAGLTILDRVAHANLNNVGIFASSNGGPLATNTIALHGKALSLPHWLVGWENPSCAQTIITDAGRPDLDPDSATDSDGNGVPGDDGKNLSYYGYSPTTLAIDYSSIIRDGQILLLDRDGDGQATFLGPPGNPRYDVDGNGILDIDEDFPIKGFMYDDGGGTRLYLSRQARAACDDLGVALPGTYASTEACAEYWRTRENAGSSYFAGRACPQTAVMLIYSEQDHVQVADDKPHIAQAYMGWQAAGNWARLNPDAAYIGLAYSGTFGGAVPPGTPDNAANCPLPANMNGSAFPSNVLAGKNYLTLGGCVEMADRLEYDKWNNDL
ncbi:MAG: hypothetical protein QF724_02805 [Planctomycetota bacterium]|nr:hypothetical protein [Planctomycetota bacterium]